MMTETGPPSAEDLQAVQEQLAEARAEVERLQATATAAISEAAALRGELSAAQEATSAEAESSRAYIEAAEARLRNAAEKYRDLVVRTEPSLPAELIAGDDINAVEASVTAARDLVGRVRTHIETEAHASRVPAGAPPRSAPDYSTLSPEQKIRLGLQQRAS
jgi:chromosome segregation ATPase